MTKLQLAVEDIFYAKFIYFLEVEQEGHQPYLLLEMVQSQAFSEYSVEKKHIKLAKFGKYLYCTCILYLVSTECYFTKAIKNVNSFL